jgi:hypothetical protein
MGVACHEDIVLRHERKVSKNIRSCHRTQLSFCPPFLVEIEEPFFIKPIGKSFP